MTIRARFDDFAAGASFVLEDAAATFVARRPDEVADVLRAAEHAARDGAEVAGFVTYEAAPGLDADLAVAEWPREHPLASLPLAWFTAFRDRRPVSAPLTDFNLPDAEWALDRTAGWHRDAVDAIRAAIAAGDYYQLNLTARLVGRVTDPDQLYAAAGAAQRGAYHALIRTGEFSVVSCSPELFFDWDGHTIRTTPMKGTAPRGRWAAEDLARAEALRWSPKERAENAMIVDLLRNDLSRVAETGTVIVPALFAAERYPTVWQLTSTIVATTRRDVDLADVFGALFPSGSITGAPKQATMAAIADLERRPRGVYCGAVGCLSPGPGRPSARFAVAIRTATCVDATGYAEFGTGGAITWSSQPDAEWAELLAKTRVLTAPEQPRQLLETLRFDPGGGFVNVARHLVRLEQSADYFGFRFSSGDVRDELLAAADGRALPARVRIVLERCGDVRVDVTDFVPTTNDVRLAMADVGVRSDDALLFHKHCDRARYDAARAAHPSVDDVVLWNERDEVTETTIANIALRLDGRWCTPPLDCGLLPGVERGRLVEEGVLAERVIGVGELRAASDIAVINSLRGWRPARVVE